jgi:hypothetical protein
MEGPFLLAFAASKAVWPGTSQAGKSSFRPPFRCALSRTSRSSGADLNSGGAEYGFCRLTKGTGAGFHWKVEHSRQLNTYRLNQSITATRYNPGVY